MRMREAALVAVAVVAWSGCGEANRPGANAETNSGSSPLTAPVDYLGAVGKAQQRAVKTVDTASLNQAIQLFQVEHDRYPRNLDELVQGKFLPKLPDPPAGMKFAYDPLAGTVKVVKQ